MKADQSKQTIRDLLDLRNNSMLSANPEYQRGAVWSQMQQRKLIDSIFRGYPLPVIYLHHIKKGVGNFKRDDFEIIDGQQRLNAIHAFREGAFALYDPKVDLVARFPAFIRDQECPWAGSTFDNLDDSLRERFLETEIPVAMIKSDQQNEVRDLFVRLQSGLPLNHQETRDAWPGNFTDYILKLGGKPQLDRYPGHQFFSETLRMRPATDRGKTRQLSAQLAMLFLNKRQNGPASFVDINAEALNDFYYGNLDFDQTAPAAQRLHDILSRLHKMLNAGQHAKLRAHDAMHAVLLIDTLMDDYSQDWADRFPDALDRFLEGLAVGKKDNLAGAPNEFWSRYGQWTRVNSDRGDIIAIRHAFYLEKMLEYLQPLRLKDPQRLFGELERTILYYHQGKRCAVCDGLAEWRDVEVHHVEEHSKGGLTSMDNGAVVHKSCHPKGADKTRAFAEKWAKKNEALVSESF